MTAVLSLTSCSKSHSLGRLGESGNQNQNGRNVFLPGYLLLMKPSTLQSPMSVAAGAFSQRNKKKMFSQIHHNSSYRDDQVVETIDTFLASGREWSRNRADAG